jgi:hypothetical protein
MGAADEFAGKRGFAGSGEAGHENDHNGRLSLKRRY